LLRTWVTYLPRQLGQHSTVPFLPPWPSHLSQITFFCRASFLVAPLCKSSKVTERNSILFPTRILLVPP
uniref:Uncharacterized protein n=1 Tax=Neovison vison TaxID=452646 RepID=A0A8C7ELZ6_NEOVI